ncbi:MAG: DUF4270 domain-containing protein [Cyclobacteriaceae bacterium]|nr:DUF4270 family protein [Cyclobacteriaceae bacterium]MCB0498883.1 DUF4270 family protein [Cyclobacteriaceae bacterium]MCB9237603.1 DUF4270 family protein [Flammeovirgaceae bacterium]MCO5270295.1 DUF4270 domain-containing protein [Cyclobacteriaceae bacterium]MCW5902271.1 DUF4270 family protein [Cyclobacteriaceae bacterium]
MNLWGRAAGHIFLAFLFLIACSEDENNLLGFKTNSEKFKVTYQEVPVASSVMLLDSVLTYNNLGHAANGRLLIGRYHDNTFGEIAAEAYTQFGPIKPVVTIPETATLVSGYLVLSPDFYQYGDGVTSTNSFSVHELLDSIPPVTSPLTELPKRIQGVPGYQPYYFNSSIPYDPDPIGSTVFTVDPSGFNQKYDAIKNKTGNLDPKTIDTLRIQLNSTFSNKLFAMARNQTADYTSLSRFRRIFKGLVIRPGATDTKVMGFNPDIDSTTFSKSRIILTYDEPDATSGGTVRKTLEYSIFSAGLIGFTKITADRSGTPLSVLPAPGMDVGLDGTRYYQSGNPVTTKLNFDPFLQFGDTIPNVVFNSVQLSIDVDDTAPFTPPPALRLRYLNASNRFVNFYSGADTEATFPLYPSMTFDEDGWYVIGQQINALIVGPSFDLIYNAEDKRYTADLTDFFQTLHNVKDAEVRYTNFALVSSEPPMGKSVNRTTFNKDNVKLKVFYTVPVVSQ